MEITPRPIGYVTAGRVEAIDDGWDDEALDWPAVGIFAQRGRVRPNRLAVSVCRLAAIRAAADGQVLTVVGLDAIVGSPVLDIKPVLTGFMALGEISQPAWATEIMADYW